MGRPGDGKRVFYFFLFWGISCKESSSREVLCPPAGPACSPCIGHTEAVGCGPAVGKLISGDYPHLGPVWV